jgi:hypothetical protein
MVEQEENFEQQPEVGSEPATIQEETSNEASNAASQPFWDGRRNLRRNGKLFYANRREVTINVDEAYAFSDLIHGREEVAVFAHGDLVEVLGWTLGPREGSTDKWWVLDGPYFLSASTTSEKVV